MTDLGKSLWQARTNGTVLTRGDFAGVDGRDGAYAVQAAAADAAGLKRVGWKIAATSDVSQGLIGVDGPAMGPVFRDHLHPTPATLTVVPAHGSAIECEIAFVMKSAVTEADAGREAVLAATARALIAVEMIGCRVEGGVKGAGPVVLVSDYAFNAALVTGPAIDNWRAVDLIKIKAAAVINGEVRNEGTGAAVLGDPVNSLVWAANEAVRIGRPLQAGDIISTGTMTGVTPVKAGDKLSADFGPFGKIEVAFV